MIERYRNLLLLFLFLSLCIILSFPEIIFFNEIFVERDISRYYYPLRFLVTSLIHKGILPLWNPYMFCGIPLLATHQNCIFYPLSIIYYIGDFYKMFDVFIFVHIILSGIFMYMLMRDLGLSSFGSIFSGISFAFSGYITSTINLTIALCSVAWFPLVLYLFRRCVIRKSVKYSIYLAMALCTMFLAGDPHIVAITILLLFFTSIYIFLERFFELKMVSIYIFVLLFISIVLFLFLSAFQIVPLFEFIRQSERVFMSYKDVVTWSILPHDLFGIVIPFFKDINVYYFDFWTRQSWLDNYYCGIIPIFFMFVALLFAKNKRVLQFSILGLFFTAFCMGKYTAIYGFFYHFIPGFNLLRYPVRYFFIPTFAICALSGIGFDYYQRNLILKRKISHRLFAKLVFYSAFVSAVCFLILTKEFQQIYNFVWNFLGPKLASDVNKNILELANFIYMDMRNIQRLFGLFSLLGLLFYVGTQRRIRSNILLSAIVVLSTVDLMSTNLKYEYTLDRDIYLRPMDNIKFISKDKSLYRVYATPSTVHYHMKPPEKYFFTGINNSKDRFITNRMIEYGIYDLSGYSSVYLNHHVNILYTINNTKKPSDTNLLNMLNVKYLCSVKMDKEKINNFRVVHKTDIAKIYQNEAYLPRAYFAERAVVINDNVEILNKIKDKSFEPTKEVVLDRQPIIESNRRGQNLLYLKQDIKDLIEFVKYEPNEVILQVSTSRPRFLVLADTYYPGWKVFIDGKKERIYRANLFLRAVYLSEPGIHTIRFVFIPFTFKLGVIISLLGIIIIFAILRLCDKIGMYKYV